ncbi:DUF6881 domain-containing protein [Nocardia sp. NPDC056000]|uniref:DUF6881 domain-containing protein n=1 Tax=Nocardia sp. NPDC056000 TaxID=3345674 RepID=UPI0035E10BD3
MEFELPRPDVLWTTIADHGYAFLNLADGSPRAIKVFRADEPTWAVGNRLVSEDGTGNWYALVNVDAERALLFGGDESTALVDTDFDPWASAPPWAAVVDRTVVHPRLHEDVVTFVRWWDGIQWCRTPFEADLPDEYDDEPDADDGLYAGLWQLFDPAWTPEDERRPSDQAQYTYGFVPGEPGMRYWKINAHTATGTESRQVVVEIDANGYEVRKVEYFADGRRGFAGGIMSTLRTQLSATPVAAIAEHPGMVETISPREFEAEWLAVGACYR